MPVEFVTLILLASYLYHRYLTFYLLVSLLFSLYLYLKILCLFLILCYYIYFCCIFYFYLIIECFLNWYFISVYIQLIPGLCYNINDVCIIINAIIKAQVTIQWICAVLAYPNDLLIHIRFLKRKSICYQISIQLISVF